MVARGVTSPADIARFTPALNVSATWPLRSSSYAIHGVGLQYYSTGASTTVGLYEDEVSLPYHRQDTAPDRLQSFTEVTPHLSISTVVALVLGLWAAKLLFTYLTGLSGDPLVSILLIFVDTALGLALAVPRHGALR
jgi:hypothetical protein